MRFGNCTGLALTLIVLAGCGPGSDATDPAEEATLGDPGTLADAAACAIKTAGWYRHSSGCLCYYAELKKVCGTDVYAYMRNLNTNELVTFWYPNFAYSCFLPVPGGQYRGQWAIGNAAGPKTPIETFSSINAYSLLPRTRDAIPCPGN